jgi:hypothetical protein
VGAADDLGLAEHADRNALVVEIDPDVKHGWVMTSMYLANATSEFQVTRLTEASFIVSKPNVSMRTGLTSSPSAGAKEPESRSRQ